MSREVLCSPAHPPLSAGDKKGEGEGEREREREREERTDIVSPFTVVFKNVGCRRRRRHRSIDL
jgi:hypothetical protein